MCIYVKVRVWSCIGCLCVCMCVSLYVYECVRERVVGSVGLCVSEKLVSLCLHVC